jgi:hypothetical protein
MTRGALIDVDKNDLVRIFNQLTNEPLMTEWRARASSWTDRLRNWVFDPVKAAERNFLNLVLDASIARSLHEGAGSLSQEILLVPTAIEPP